MKPSRRVIILFFALFFTATIIYVATFIARHPEIISLNRDDLERLSFVGTFIAGVANIIALIWVSATLTQQGADIAEQIKEMNAQGKISRQQSTIIQDQLLLDLLGRLESRLAQQIRNLVILLDSGIDIKQIDSLFLSGDKDIYYKMIMENSYMMDKLKCEINNRSDVINIYISKFLQQSDFIRVLIKEKSHDPLIQALHENSYAYSFRDVISSLIASRSFAQRIE